MKLADLSFGEHKFGHSYANEKIILIVHHHWWHLVKLAAGSTFLFALPFIVVPIVAASAGANIGQIGPIAVFLGAVWALFFWHKIFTEWTDYYFDVWIITNWRIIDIELLSLFNMNIGSMLDLDHIQEIITETRGIVNNLLGVGSLQIQTAATNRGQFLYNDVAHPADIENTIRRAQIELDYTKEETRKDLGHGV